MLQQCFFETLRSSAEPENFTDWPEYNCEQSVVVSPVTNSLKYMEVSRSLLVRIEPFQLQNVCENILE